MHVWTAFLSEQEKQLGKQTVDEWLRPLKLIDFDAANIYLEAQDSFQIAWFEEQIRPKIKNLRTSSGRPIKIHLTLGGPTQFTSRSAKAKNYCPVLDLSQNALDPSYSLENFLVTPSNEVILKCIEELLPEGRRFSERQGHGTPVRIPPKPSPEGLGLRRGAVHEMLAAEKPALNPLLIHGNSGSGKTHLLSGIAQAYKERGTSIFFTSAETFTEHVVAAIRNGAMQEFRKAYRNVDVLIVDDAHQFARKIATQEEFFHTFNTLHGNGKQIILSADVSPQYLQHIEPRLISRFEWGLVLHLQNLNEQECEKWLVTRAQSLGLIFSQESVDFLLKTFHAQTKPLAQALQAIVLRSHLAKKSSVLDPLTLQTLLKDLIEEEKRKELTPEKIIHSVATYYGMRSDDLLGKSQTKEATIPRQMAMYLCRQNLKLSYMKIGEIFDRDHSTVMTSVKLVESKLQTQENDWCVAKSAILKLVNERS
jgi:chromosomal replication initiator protein